MSIRIFSYGGGVQSTAALVLAAQGRIDFPTFLFAHVGEDSENPATLRYVWDVAMPYAAAQGIELVEVRWVRRDGRIRSLYEETLDPALAAIPIPVRSRNGRPGTRACTTHYKVYPISAETKRRGATPAQPAVVGMGISIDEYERMNQSRIKWHINAYPLIDRRLSRADCAGIIARAGLPVPPKSSCWFCPFRTKAGWREYKAQHPDVFAQAVAFEEAINRKRAAFGKKPVYLHRDGRLLPEAVAHDQGMIETDDTCESGYCMT